MFKKRCLKQGISRQSNEAQRISTAALLNKFRQNFSGQNSGKIWMKGGLGAALLLSGLAHIFFTSAVTIVTPRDFFRTEPFTSVTFLGPILEKTAFDIMVSSDETSFRPTEMHIPTDLSKIVLSRGTGNHFPPQEKLTPDPGIEIYRIVRDSLPSRKLQPDIFFKKAQGLSPGPETVYTSVSGRGRTVIYRPDIQGVFFGGERGLGADKLKVTVAASVDGYGNVVKTRVTRTSGSSSADILACEVLSEWKFQPSGNVGEEEDLFETEIIIDPVAGGVGDDKT